MLLATLRNLDDGLMRTGVGRELLADAVREGRAVRSAPPMSIDRHGPDGSAAAQRTPHRGNSGVACSHRGALNPPRKRNIQSKKGHEVLTKDIDGTQDALLAMHVANEATPRRGTVRARKPQHGYMATWNSKRP